MFRKVANMFYPGLPSNCSRYGQGIEGGYDYEQGIEGYG